MATARIQYTVTQDIPSEGVYAVTFTVIDVTDIEAEIFIFDVEYSAFVGVCTLHSMRNYPRTRAEAVTQGISFFRAMGVVRTFPTIDLAMAFVAVTEGRIEALRRSWQTYLDEYAQSVTITTPE
jgi:hypothetical protein